MTNKEILKKISQWAEEQKKHCVSCENNEEFQGDECNKEYNQAITDLQAFLTTLGGEE